MAAASVPLKRNYKPEGQYRGTSTRVSHAALTSYSSFAMAAVGGAGDAQCVGWLCGGGRGLVLVVAVVKTVWQVEALAVSRWRWEAWFGCLECTTPSPTKHMCLPSR